MSMGIIDYTKRQIEASRVQAEADRKATAEWEATHSKPEKRRAPRAAKGTGIGRFAALTSGNLGALAQYDAIDAITAQGEATRAAASVVPVRQAVGAGYEEGFAAGWKAAMATVQNSAH